MKSFLCLSGKQPDYDRSDVLLDADFCYYSNGGPSITVDYSTRVGRSDHDEDTINPNLRQDF